LLISQKTGLLFLQFISTSKITLCTCYCNMC